MARPAAGSVGRQPDRVVAHRLGAAVRLGGVPDAQRPPLRAADVVVDLGREPSPNELKTFIDAWKSETCRPATILHAILTSTEYQHY